MFKVVGNGCICFDGIVYIGVPVADRNFNICFLFSTWT
jgi:hypothetical protein